MIPDRRTPEELAQDFRWARLIRNCPWCGELVRQFSFSRFDGWSLPFDEEYPETGVAEGYCPNCEAFLEMWGRGKGDKHYEFSTRRWFWNAAHTAVETTDPIFDRPPAANVWRADAMTHFANYNASAFKAAKWQRDLIGPRCQDDDEKFTVSVPKEFTGEALEGIVDHIRKTLSKLRSGSLKKREDLPDRTELHFGGRTAKSGAVLMLWEAGQIPASVAIWNYNDGRRYPLISWDYQKAAPRVHPSFLPPEERPKPAPVSDSRPRLKKTASVEEALAWLCARMEDIATDHPEFTDTAIRDNIGDVLEDGFLRPKDGARIPKSFGMDSISADLKIQSVLKSFTKIAAPAAEARALSPQHRLDLMNQLPFGELIGYRESI